MIYLLSSIRLVSFYITWVCSIVHGETGQSDTGYDDQQLIMKVLNIVVLIVYFCGLAAAKEESRGKAWSRSMLGRGW